MAAAVVEEDYVSKKDLEWFMKAMQEQTDEATKRMKEITLSLINPDLNLGHFQIQALLGEILNHVDYFNMAEVLASIDGLVPLIHCLNHSYTGIRGQAAKVVAEIVQDNPKGQKRVMDANALEPLLRNFSSEYDTFARIDALDAISSLIRHNESGFIVFHQLEGYVALKNALGFYNFRLQRKILNLVQHLLQENKPDSYVVSDLGFPRTMVHLASSVDRGVREAALGGLLELARNETNDIKSILADDGRNLKQILEEQITNINKIAPEDLEEAEEEQLLLCSLWKSCYNEPSSLQEKVFGIFQE